VSLPDRRRLLVSDTVGFIDRLPHTLVAAFRATLEQVAEADLILHVIDAASQERDQHAEAVRKVLEEVGALGVARLEVFNKSDLLDADDAAYLRRSHPEALFISALRGTGRSDVIDTVAKLLELDTHRVHLEFDSRSAEDREKIARVYRHARVVSHEDHDGRVAIEADVSRRDLDRVSSSR
jgi:GTP-binding protein HflX